MTLSEWANLHPDNLVAEPPDKSAIAELCAVADREIRDAERVESYDGRLGHAYTVCLALAAAALAASGYRVRHGSPAHHWRLIESLEHTLGLTPAEVKELQDYRKKRSLSVYQRAGIVTSTEAESALTAACETGSRPGLHQNIPTFCPSDAPDDAAPSGERHLPLPSSPLPAPLRRL